MLKPTSKLIEEIDNRLLDFFGIPEKTIPANSLEALVRGILSQNTSDINRDRAFDRLKTLVPDFKDLFNTEQEEIEKAIKPAGLGRQRAERIKHLVGWLNEKYGNFNCDFLCDLEPNESFETLTSLPGIGVKTAAVFLLFVCGFDYFPVDTHIKRIFKRIGLFPSKFTAERIQLEISPYIKKGLAYNLHLNLLKLGRTICFPRNPNCMQCPINNICQEGQGRIKNEEEDTKRN